MFSLNVVYRIVLIWVIDCFWIRVLGFFFLKKIGLILLSLCVFLLVLIHLDGADTVDGLRNCDLAIPSLAILE